MWIAKPIRKLSPSEIAGWQSLESCLPLAQTLSWANAVESVRGSCFLIFNLQEKVGGIIFTTGNLFDNDVQFECINGPHLDWDQPQVATRQLATFAVAASKLSPRFRCLKLRPRWECQLTGQRIQELPISPHSYSHAATIIVPVLESDEIQLQSFHPRLQRTLSYNMRLGIQTEWTVPERDSLEKLVQDLAVFGREKGFHIPPLRWFEALIFKNKSQYSTLQFRIGRATYFESDQILSESQILLAFHDQTAHYLFGCETRKSNLRSSISTASLLHWEAFRICRGAGIHSYDLNGYVPNTDPTHSYSGVSRFKEQFSGRVIRYDVPEFVIET